ARCQVIRFLPFLACLEISDRRIAPLFESGLNPLHDDVVDFASLMEGGFSQGLMNRLGEVKARMDHVWAWSASRALPGHFGTSRRCLRAFGQFLAPTSFQVRLRAILAAPAP